MFGFSSIVTGNGVFSGLLSSRSLFSVLHRFSRARVMKPFARFSSRICQNNEVIFSVK